MSKENKVIIKNNLKVIKDELGLNQKEMADVLGIGLSTEKNYENNDLGQYGDYNGKDSHTMPIECAMILAEKYHYSLDYIYCQTSNNHRSVFSDDKQINSFEVDIRDFISVQNDNLVISIPDCFLEYVIKLRDIADSNDTQTDKNKKKLELDANTSMLYTKNGKQYCASIPLSSMKTYMCGVPFADPENDPRKKKPKQQSQIDEKDKQKLISVFEEIINEERQE